MNHSNKTGWGSQNVRSKREKTQTHQTKQDRPLMEVLDVFIIDDEKPKIRPRPNLQFNFSKKKEEEMEDKTIKGILLRLKSNVRDLDALISDAENLKDNILVSMNELSDYMLEKDFKPLIDPKNCLHSRRNETENADAKTTTCRDCGMLLVYQVKC